MQTSLGSFTKKITEIPIIPSGGPFYLPKYFFFKPNIQETQRLPQKSTFNSSGKLEEAPFFMETWNIFACLTQQCMLRCAACTVRQVQNLNVTWLLCATSKRGVQVSAEVAGTAAWQTAVSAQEGALKLQRKMTYKVCMVKSKGIPNWCELFQLNGKLLFNTDRLCTFRQVQDLNVT